MNTSNSTKSRLAGVGVALVAATALPLGLAATAQASTTHDGCTVTPAAAEFRGTFDASGLKEIFYPYEVTCVASASGLSVEAKTYTREQDLAGRAGDVDANGINNSDDDVIGQATTSRSFGPGGGTKTVTVKGLLPRTDTDGNDEVYQKIKFHVTSGPVTGSWSPLELTAATRIFW